MPQVGSWCQPPHHTQTLRVVVVQAGSLKQPILYLLFSQIFFIFCIDFIDQFWFGYIKERKQKVYQKRICELEKTVEGLNAMFLAQEKKNDEKEAKLLDLEKKMVSKQI